VSVVTYSLMKMAKKRLGEVMTNNDVMVDDMFVREKFFCIKYFIAMVYLII
jgi:hypothetical protein